VVGFAFVGALKWGEGGMTEGADDGAHGDVRGYGMGRKLPTRILRRKEIWILGRHADYVSVVDDLVDGVQWSYQGQARDGKFS
jgi:hypothetical protein